MWKTIVSGVLAIALIWVLDHPLQVGQTSLPALGQFFAPSHGFWQNAEGDSPETLDLQISELTQDVRVVFDDRLVPHIFAQNVSDLCRAQGYVTAMHRLWQMDFSTRAATGRISEVVGPRALAYDQRQRQLGMTFAAGNAIESWKQFPEEFALLEAYSEGVNAYIRSLDARSYPVEYKLMNFAPEPWTPLKSALFFKSMAARLCLREYDVEFSTLLEMLGPEQFDHWFPEKNPKQDPIIPPGTVWDFDPVPLQADPVDSLTIKPSVGMRIAPEQDVLLGSNNWAVDGSKTASGAPILCNDPHLALSLPSVWHEVHLHAPNYNSYGVSLPGMPGVIIGFNEHIAWGLTNVGHDMLDWYRIKWANDDQTYYILDGKATPVTVRIERYRIAGAPDVVDTVAYTRWGPVWKEGAYADLAMRWLAHDKTSTAELAVFGRLNQATNLDEFHAALDHFQTPAQNFVYADKAGNIAMRIGGKLPLRSPGHGKFVLDGAKTSSGWQGFIPPRHNPMVVNPPRGFVSSANQRTTADDYPYYYLGGRYFEDYRGRILNEKLAAMDNITVPDMQALQYDSESLKARELLPYLLEAANGATGTDQKRILDTLATWDFRYRATSIAPVFWEEWYSAFYDLVWDEFDDVPDSVLIVRPESWRTLELAMTEQDAPAFDLKLTDQKEAFHHIAVMSLDSAAARLAGIDNDRWRWGAYRRTRIAHLANIEPFNVVLHNAPGDGDALNATGSTAGPSWRMVVHLTDPVEAHVIYPGGQSGNPGSPYYDDMITDWTEGRYYPVQFPGHPDEVEAQLSIHLKSRKQ